MGLHGRQAFRQWFCASSATAKTPFCLCRYWIHCHCFGLLGFKFLPCQQAVLTNVWWIPQQLPVFLKQQQWLKIFGKGEANPRLKEKVTALCLIPVAQHFLLLDCRIFKMVIWSTVLCNFSNIRSQKGYLPELIKTAYSTNGGEGCWSALLHSC